MNVNVAGIIFQNRRCFIGVLHKQISTRESLQKRNDLFDQEKKRQREAIGRIGKIEVRHLEHLKDITLVMNKGISTPYNCAQHLGSSHCQRSALALVNGKIPWDMHRPLEESCTLQLLSFTEADNHIVNRAFWRTCSFMLGAALHENFKDEARLELHSFPGPNVKFGSFVHDFAISARGWKPSFEELQLFSASMKKFSSEKLDIERLDVAYDLALEMFDDNHFKLEQLPSISSKTEGKITLYRMGKHIDISRGPMISNTKFLDRCTISAVHEIGTKESIYRAQGIALPVGIKINHFSYKILEERSKRLNPARLPTELYEEQLN